jgi:hypothetical protein
MAWIPWLGCMFCAKGATGGLPEMPGGGTAGVGMVALIGVAGGGLEKLAALTRGAV